MSSDLPPLRPSSWLSHFEGLPLAAIETSVRFPRGVSLRDPLCSVVRGLFGERLRALRCRTGAPSCVGCSEARRCDYAHIFEGQPAHSPVFATGNAHGYWLQGVPAEAVLLPGAELRARLVIAGPALDRAPYLEVAFRDALHKVAYGGARGSRCELAAELSASSIEPIPLRTIEWNEGHALRIETLTPLLLRGDLAVCSQIAPGAPPFALLARAAVRRLDALFRAFVPGIALPRFAFPIMTDTEMMDAGAFVSWKSSRYSKRQERRMPLEGVTGAIVVKGAAVPTLAPLLALASVVGVGKATTMGFGQIRIEPVVSVGSG